MTQAQFLSHGDLIEVSGRATSVISSEYLPEGPDGETRHLLRVCDVSTAEVSELITTDEAPFRKVGNIYL